MDLLKMGQDILADKLGDKAGGIMEALSGGDGGLDLGGLVEKLKAGGLSDQVGSWLGDGDNAPVSADQIKSALGEDEVAVMATKMGVDTDTAAEQLTQAVPSLMDKLSSGGSLLDKFGGVSGALDMAKGLLK